VGAAGGELTPIAGRLLGAPGPLCGRCTGRSMRLTASWETTWLCDAPGVGWHCLL